MKHKYTLSDAFEFGWPGLKGKSYNSKENFANASAACFEVTTHHGRAKTTLSDRIYYVIDGKGEFDIAGEIFEVDPTDVIIVPKDTEYDYKAKNNPLKLFMIHTPAYEENSAIDLEKTKEAL